MSSRRTRLSRFRRVALPAVLALAVAPSGAYAYPIHQVTPGETLSSIAAANGMQIARLAAANGLAWNAYVTAGQVLQIPPQDGAYTSTSGQTMGYATSSTPITSAPATSSATPTSSSSSSSSGGSSSGSSSGGSGHQVNPGETLSAIAARLGVTIQALAAANGIANPNLIYSGTTLKAPAPGTTATPAPSTVPVSTTTRTTSTTSSSTGPEGSAAYNGGGAGNSSERLTSGQVASIAAQHGVPGNLAAAIAWQESGNNNALVSSTGARGVMQIMPGTWEWINGTLAKTPLQTHSAAENVRAGSLLLKALLKETGGDEATAIAGYYQGLNSVRSRGMYDDTKQYVQNVQALKARVGG